MTVTNVHTFKSELRKWGRVYGVEVPIDISVVLGIGEHIPVVGRVNGAEFHATLTPTGGAQHRLFVDSTLRRKIKSKVDDELEISMQQDLSNRVPPLPDDLSEALNLLTGARDRFENWPQSRRREILLWIAETTNPETRSRRIARAVVRAMEDT